MRVSWCELREWRLICTLCSVLVGSCLRTKRVARSFSDGIQLRRNVRRDIVRVSVGQVWSKEAVRGGACYSGDCRRRDCGFTKLLRLHCSSVHRRSSGTGACAGQPASSLLFCFNTFSSLSPPNHRGCTCWATEATFGTARRNGRCDKRFKEFIMKIKSNTINNDLPWRFGLHRRPSSEEHETVARTGRRISFIFFWRRPPMETETSR